MVSSFVKATQYKAHLIITNKKWCLENFFLFAYRGSCQLIKGSQVIIIG